MSLLEILLVAIGVAADAFAVAVCKGMAKGKFELSYASGRGAVFRGISGTNAGYRLFCRLGGNVTNKVN